MTLETILAQHQTLGRQCTCGERLPKHRLDTNAWFAAHVADVIREWLTNDERELARLIWETSRADESTISATGAEHIARAITAALTNQEQQP